MYSNHTNYSPSPIPKHSDQQLRTAIDGVFSKYDKDKSNTLDRSQLESVIRDVFNRLKVKRNPKELDMNKFMNSVDKNNDGIVTRLELYEIFKKIGML